MATFTIVEHVNPLLTLSAPLIRISAEGDPDGLAAAIVRQVEKSGTVFLELPGGRVALILDLSGGPSLTRPPREYLKD